MPSFTALHVYWHYRYYRYSFWGSICCYYSCGRITVTFLSLIRARSKNILYSRCYNPRDEFVRSDISLGLSLVLVDYVDKHMGVYALVLPVISFVTTVECSGLTLFCFLLLLLQLHVSLLSFFFTAIYVSFYTVRKCGSTNTLLQLSLITLLLLLILILFKLICSLCAVVCRYSGLPLIAFNEPD